MSELVVQVAAVCAGLATIAGVARFAGRPVWRLVRRVNAFLEDWNGEPARAGRARVPSMPERMATVETGLAAVRRQVTPNGGDSDQLGDKVVRIEQRLGTGLDNT